MLKVAAVIVGLLLAGALLWIAGEMHYANCVDAAEVRGVDNPFARDNEILNPTGAASTAELVQGCSRLP